MYLYQGLIWIGLLLLTAGVRADVCASDYKQLAVIQELYASLHNTVQGRTSTHVLRMSNGKGWLEIGYLTSEDPRFLKALGRAVSAGVVTKIKVGPVVGPKALNWLARTMDQAPKDQNLVVTAYMHMNELIQVRDLQLLSWKEANKHGGHVDVGLEWPDEELARFEKSLGRLGIREACLKYWKTDDLRNCLGLDFRFEKSAATPVVWSPIRGGR